MTDEMYEHKNGNHWRWSSEDDCVDEEEQSE